MSGTTQFAPLVAIGCYVRDYDLLSPIASRLSFSQHTHTQYPLEALIGLWVSILAGCRSVWQINTKTRPDLVLAQAWGREQFAEQSTIARILDVCQAEQVDQLRQGYEQVYHWMGQAPRHNWLNGGLMIDIDLTGLPAGRQAQGSTKGYFSGKRGSEVGNCAASAPPIMMKQWLRCSIQATP
jgi:hypothetical protein